MVLWNLYYQEIKTFLTSLSVLNKSFAEIAKNETTTRFGVVDLHPEANPYFVNLFGNYTYKNEPMYVISLDTGEEIEFTISNLNRHTKTKSYYKIGQPGYDILCKKYPLQTGLIKSIVCPISVNYDTSELSESEYLNFQGRYSITDIPMIITSLDTSTQEVLTLELLNNPIHTQTRLAYRLPSSYYFELLSRYPDQAALIHGILQPNCPVFAIQKLNDFTVLGYDSEALFPRELQSIVDAVQNTLAYIRERWFIPEYSIEEFYPGMFWAMVWYVLHIVVYQQRHLNIRTPSVHPLHIWEYLQSVGLNIEYRKGLTDDQAWFLYKNMQHLISNKGTSDNLNKLIEGLLSKLNTTVRAKLMVHNTNLLPTEVYRRPEILSRYITDFTTPLEDQARGVESVDQVIKREYELGLEPVYSDEVVNKQTSKLQNSRITRLPTKLVEIRRFDLDDSERYPYAEFAFHTAISFIERKISNYSFRVSFGDIDQHRYFTMGEALAAMHFMICKLSGTTQTDIPNTFFIRSAFQHPLPILEDKNIITPELTNPESMFKILNFQTGRDSSGDPIWYTVNDYMNDIHQTTSVISSEDFISELDKQYASLYHWYILMRDSVDFMFYKAVDQLLHDILDLREVVLDPQDGLVPGITTYAEWKLSDPQINTLLNHYSTSPTLMETFIQNIMKVAFIFENSKYAGGFEMSRRQYALMRSLFENLCSYNIAILDTPVVDKTYASLKPITSVWSNVSSTGEMLFDAAITFNDSDVSSEEDIDIPMALWYEDEREED